MVARTLLISIAMLGAGIFLIRAGSLFGLVFTPAGGYGIVVAAVGFRRPSRLVLTADGFEWTSQWHRVPVRHAWQECGPFELISHSRRADVVGYTTDPRDRATIWQGPATAWRGTPTPRFGKLKSISGTYSTIGPKELVVLMNQYRSWALQQPTRYG
jgi:hypothetical protein